MEWEEVNQHSEWGGVNQHLERGGVDQHSERGGVLHPGRRPGYKLVLDLNLELSAYVSHAQIGSDSLGLAQNQFSLGFMA